MGIETKATQLIQRLTRATVNGEVTWSQSSPPKYLTSGTDDVIAVFLRCTYKDTRIGLFEKRTKYFHDEFDYTWGARIGLCVVDPLGEMLWEYSERSSALNNLFEIARETSSGIDRILDKLLDDET